MGIQMQAENTLGIGGSTTNHISQGDCFFSTETSKIRFWGGRNTLTFQAWHHVVFVREGDQVRVHLDGRTQPEIDGVFFTYDSRR